MNGSLTQLLLLADANRFRSLGNHFRGRRAEVDGGDLLTGLILLGCVVLVGYLLSRLLARQERQRSYNKPAALFRQLCKAHQLDRYQRRLLRELAAAQQVEPAARLFLEPEHFQPSHLGSLVEAEEILLLRDRLFAVPLPAASAESQASAASEARSDASEPSAVH